jgi:hypothetical protein
MPEKREPVPFPPTTLLFMKRDWVGALATTIQAISHWDVIEFLKCSVVPSGNLIKAWLGVSTNKDHNLKKIPPSK